MKSKTQTIAALIGIAVLSMQFIACTKQEDVTANLNSEEVSNATASVSNANLIAWYKFTKGNTADYSGNNNHLTAFNATLDTDYMGRPKNAYYFNGFSSYMQVPNSSSLNPSSKISLVALFKPKGYYTGPGATSRILMKGTDDQTNGDYFLGFNNTGDFYGTYGDNQSQSNGVGSPLNLLNLNTWYKLVYTYDGRVGKLYVNDVLVNKVVATATFTPNSDPLNIGKTGRSDFPYFFNGVIDEIRIYNIALTAGQVIKVDSQLGK